MHTDVWNLSTLLLAFGAALNLIHASQTSLTTTESPTHGLRVIQDRRNGSAGPCSRDQRCCKLGRKAARKSYTCQFEVLVKSLEFQIASRHRLNPAADRLQAALSYHNHAEVFRRRLRRCQDPLKNRCFEYCCKGMSAKLARLMGATPQPTNSSRPVQQRKRQSH